MLRKKLLSLGLASVMVAGVAIPANAQIITGDDTKTLDANVTVTGTVSDNQGTAPQGKLQVEVPTSLAFSVDQSSNFTGTTFTIDNQSATAINVSVGSFKETKPDDGIKVVAKGTDMTEENRASVIMRLSGDADIDLGGTIDSNQVLKRIEATSSANIQLLGEAGTKEDADNVDANGASENFDLVFKIKKAQ